MPNITGFKWLVLAVISAWISGVWFHSCATANPDDDDLCFTWFVMFGLVALAFIAIFIVVAIPYLKCPVCGEVYISNIQQYCPVDGAELILK